MSYIIEKREYTYNPNRFIRLDRCHSISNNIALDVLSNTSKPMDASGYTPDSAISMAGSAWELQSSIDGMAIHFDRTASNQIDVANNGQFYDYDKNGLWWTGSWYFTYEGVEDANEYALSNDNSGIGGVYASLGFTDSTVEDGMPHVLTVVVDDTNATVYIDCIQKNQIAHGLSAFDSHLIRYQSNINAWEIFLSQAGVEQDLQIGGTPQKSTDRWQGKIYRSTYWMRALGVEEIHSIGFNPWWGLYDDEVIVYKPSASGITGSLAETLDNTTSSASGGIYGTGSLAETMDDVSCSASGTVGSGITGSLAETLDNITSSANGEVAVIGSLSETMEDISSNAAGEVAVIGSLAETMDDISSSASGAINATGTLSEILEDIACNASGFNQDITGTLNQTMDDVSCSGSGIVGVQNLPPGSLELLGVGR